MKILKKRILATPDITVRWDTDLSVLHKKKVEGMTEDEQADEIIRRLKAPCAPKVDYELEEQYAEILSAIITKEIDKELLKSVTYYGRKKYST